MKPENFPQVTACLNAPENLPEVQPLYVAQTIDGRCISLWRASWRERLCFLIRGEAWISVLSGRTQPPVAVQVESPFYKVKAPKKRASVFDWWFPEKED